MRVLFYSCERNINTYLLINEVSKEAILINPCDIVQHFIKKLENEHILLKAGCITNSNIEEIKQGIKTWQNIYDFPLFEVQNFFEDNTHFFKKNQFSSFNIETFGVKTKKASLCIYKIENALFTCESLFASFFQSSVTNNEHIREKISTFDEHTLVFPLSGPPTTLKNIKLKETL